MGGDHCFLPGGNGRLVQALAENVPIIYERTVHSTRYGGDGVQVVVNGGQVYEGGMALCTVPLGVLKTRGIRFVPGLPQRKLDNIKRLGFGLLNKVAMLLPHVFWSTDLDTFGHLVEDPRRCGEFFLFYSYATVAGGPLLMALVAGEAAHSFETTASTDAVCSVLQILRDTMAPGCVNLLMHHGGSFSKEDSLTYDGGEVFLFRNIDKDVMSYFHVVELAKNVGFKDGDTLYYSIPGRSLEDTIDQLSDDASVSEMMKFADQTSFLEIYIQHNEHDGSSYPNVGDPSGPDNINESNKVSCTGKLNKKRDKKVWTAEEEKTLIDILYEMNDSGWKADTGHKCGYLSYVEKELAKRLPHAEIKADPHIQSKVKTMKKLLSYVLDIQQNGSGFGWDDDRKMVVGDKRLFTDWAKSRPGAAALYMKPFVNYDKLCEIYASDLAKGSRAKGPGDLFEVHEEHSSAHVTEGTQQTENDADSHSHNPCHGRNSSNGGKSVGSRKRVFLEDNAIAVDFSSVAKSLKTLVDVETSNAAAYGKELEARKQTVERRDQLFNVLAKYPEFTHDQIVKSALIIGQSEAKLNMFFTTPEEFRTEFIR